MYPLTDIPPSFMFFPLPLEQRTDTAPVSQVELIPSSGVFVDSTKLSGIPFKKGWSYTLLTRSLMPMVFSKEEMATSCVRGERATGKGALTSPLRPALDQVKVQAIISESELIFRLGSLLTPLSVTGLMTKQSNKLITVNHYPQIRWKYAAMYMYSASGEQR